MRQAIAFAALLLAFEVGAQQTANSIAKAFTNITRESGIADALAKQYEAHPNWWLSGITLVDLDGDGKLDLFFSAHGAGAPLAMLGDGKGRFTVAAGSYPQTEIHLAHDINEDGKLDLQM